MWRRLLVRVVVLLFCGLVAHRVWRYATFENGRDVREMPRPAAEAEERDLYLVPGGRYTAADIEANGRTLPSRQFRRFTSQHDYNPRRGDRLCPVTRTKANPTCTWTIGGRVYQFCCPPCIDEFVRLAKERPEQIEPPDAYIK